MTLKFATGSMLQSFPVVMVFFELGLKPRDKLSPPDKQINTKVRQAIPATLYLFTLALWLIFRSNFPPLLSLSYGCLN